MNGWIPGIRQHEDYRGVILRREDERNPRDGLLAMWHRDATPEEVAYALEKLAAELRRLQP